MTPLRRLAHALTLFGLLGAAFAAPSASASLGHFGPEEFGVYSFESPITADQAETEPATLAGSHPEAFAPKILLNHEVTLEEEEYRETPAEEEVAVESPGVTATIYARPLRAEVNLPPGFVVDPQATPVKCTEAQLETTVLSGGGCPAASAVGLMEPFASPFGPNLRGAIYNMVPPNGAPAEFGYAAIGFVVHIIGRLRTGTDYGLSGYSDAITQTLPVYGFKLYLFGDPTNPDHNAQRGICATSWSPSGVAQKVEREWAEIGVPKERFDCPTERHEEPPFLTMPTSCPGTPLSTTADVTSWQEPENKIEPPPFTSPALTGCGGLQFEPEVEARPTTNVADSPSGLDFDLHIPQPENVNQLAEAHLKDATVTLPQGIAINPSVADGLATCTSAQIGYKPATTEPLEFTPAAPNCPDASKIGSVEVTTPLLEQPLPGAVYLAAQGDNPFHSLMAIYIVIDDPERGIVVKLAGHVVPDPVTGQLVTTVEESPQLPFEEFQLHFFGGARAPLRTPAVCGNYETTSTMTPWSAPESGPPATPADPYEITTAPGGGACPTSAAGLPNKPHFSAGTISAQAGAYSPFVLKLSREDGSQELRALNATLPPGLTGKLAGVAECSEAQIAQAVARSHEGQGSLERSSPSCPASSEVGTVNVAAGAGPSPVQVSGRAYLAGPYKGAPLSMAIVTPAVAGPFDLGTVVVRSALYVNPETAQITVKSDPIPTILDGIPLDVRSIAVNVSRNQFTLNPTSCNPFSIAATAFAASSEAGLSSHFQVGGCNALGFKPKLSLKLEGGTKRAKHPALRAVVTYPKGSYANIAKAQVTLPHSEFLDNAHIKTVCTRVQFAANECPAASIYGHATATTPLLDQPLSGSVYLRSSSNKLPDLVAALNGQIDVALDGRIDTGKGGGIRNTFEVVPDAPVSKFVLSMQGGDKGLLVNSENLCSPKAKTHATVHLTAQNGKVSNTEPLVKNSCGAKKHKNAHKRHR